METFSDCCSNSFLYLSPNICIMEIWKSKNFEKFYYFSLFQFYSKIFGIFTIFIYTFFLFKEVRKFKSFKEYLQNFLEKTIFTYFEIIYQKMKKKHEDEIKYSEITTKKENNLVFIFDFYDCCCECCCICWLQIFIPIIGFFKKFFNKISLKILKNSKYIGIFFVIFGNFFVLQIIFVFDFLQSDCLLESIPSKNLRFFVISLRILFIFILQSSFFFSMIFIISMISTKHELLKFPQNFPEKRALLLFYHMKKALIFAFLALILKIILIIIFSESFHESNDFSIPDNFYKLWKNCFLILLIRFLDSKNPNILSEGDKFVKNEQKYYAMKNNLLKYLPSSQSILESFKGKINSNNNNAFNNENNKKILNLMQNKCEEISKIAGESLEMDMKLINEQNYKQIFRNRGDNPIIPVIFVYYMLIDCMLSIIVSLGIFFCVWLNSKNSTNFIGLVLIFSYLNEIIRILEFILLPWLIYKTLMKITLFGFEEENKYSNRISTGNSINIEENEIKEFSDLFDYSRNLSRNTYIEFENLSMRENKFSIIEMNKGFMD